MNTMYKQLTLTLIVMLIYASVATAQIQTPAPSPKAEVSQMIGLTEVKIEYSRPGKKDRLIFGEESEGALVPYGQIWRTGANAATKISFNDDVKLNDKPVAAGEYALYTIPGKDSWTVMLYNDLGLGGAVGNYDDTKEYLRFTATPKSIDHTHETFTIAVDDIKYTSANLKIVWDQTMVPIELEVEFDTEVMAQIEQQMKNPLASAANLYFTAANYYFNAEKDLAQALEWMNKGLEINNQAFWHVHTKAKILAAMGKKNEAKETAELSKKMASEFPAGDFGYIKRNEDFIATL